MEYPEGQDDLRDKLKPSEIFTQVDRAEKRQMDVEIAKASSYVSSNVEKEGHQSIRKKCPDIRSSSIFIKKPKVEVAQRNDAASHPLFEKQAKNLSVVEDLGEGKYGWNDMTVEVQEQTLQSAPDDDKVFEYSQVLYAEKENGDWLKVRTQSKSWYSYSSKDMIQGLNIGGERAEASWIIEVNINGIEASFEEERATDPKTRATSAHWLLDSDPRISFHCLQPLRRNNITSVSQIHRSFEKIVEYLPKQDDQTEK